MDSLILCALYSLRWMVARVHLSICHTHAPLKIPPMEKKKVYNEIQRQRTTKKKTVLMTRKDRKKHKARNVMCAKKKLAQGKSTSFMFWFRCQQTIRRKCIKEKEWTRSKKKKYPILGSWHVLMRTFNGKDIKFIVRNVVSIVSYDFIFGRLPIKYYYIVIWCYWCCILVIYLFCCCYFYLFPRGTWHCMRLESINSGMTSNMLL